MNLIFDIETDGFYNNCTRIHCIGIYDLDTPDSEVMVYNDQGNAAPISQAVTMLEEADNIIGHNIINFDVPMIQKFYPFFQPKQMLDTLVLGRLYHPDVYDLDAKRKWKHMPLNLYGRHSLEAYGHRLGEYKGGFGKETDWKDWSPEMQDYMVQDVQVTHKLWNHFHKYLTGSFWK